MVKGLRRLGVVTALIGIALAGPLFVGSPAHASGCGIRFEVSFYNRVLGASHFRYCFDPDSVVPMPVKIERLDRPIGGNEIWVIVAQGRGDVSYNCNNDSPHTFRFNGQRNGVYACD
ncbi:hypothetical protein [Phytohabitans suffuscus]|uniref:Uncharacterized protein n=1 Tax=Phytohabitans suffuscus TaxID=624315 RepID=A0A6F8YVH1_9ACTN|nr:hypothetical protein [Phytohabitans suffuscus]BCB89993.1 hypothetical protein Psuf_073060 [Phytohabitans suffuscus]